MRQAEMPLRSICSAEKRSRNDQNEKENGEGPRLEVDIFWTVPPSCQTRETNSEHASSLQTFRAKKPLLCSLQATLIGGKSSSSTKLLRTRSVFDKPPASCCITHERTYLLSPSRKEERRRKENKGERRKEKGERRKEKGERSKECPIEAILNNHSLKLF